MASKKRKKHLSATSKNIAAINRNISATAAIFGTNSAEYKDAVNAIRGFETRDKNGVVQIRDIKSNRQQYQKLSSLRKKLTPASVKKRKVKNRLKKQMRREKQTQSGKSRPITNDDLRKESTARESLHDEIDMLYEEAKEHGVPIDYGLLYSTADYREYIRSEIAAAIAAEQAAYEDTVYSDDGSAYVFNPDTGEVVEEYEPLTNPDFYY